MIKTPIKLFFVNQVAFSIALFSYNKDSYRNWSCFSRLRMIETANLAAWDVSNSTVALFQLSNKVP